MRFGWKIYSPRVESECVYGPNVVDIIYCLPMALERVLLILYFWSGIYVFNRDAAFDRGCGIAYKHHEVAW